MTTKYSTGGAVSTTDPDPISRPSSSNPGDDVVSRADHDKAIETERKRQSGIERERRKLEDKVSELSSKIDQIVSNTSQRPEAAALPGLNPNDPVTAHIVHLRENMTEWQNHLRTEQQSSRAKSELREAIADVEAKGVPLDEIDDSSPDAVYRSANDFLKEKRIQDLVSTVEELKGQLTTTETRVRDETGAMVVSTATGGAPKLNTVNDQIAAVSAEMAEFKRAGKGSLVIAARKALDKLNAYKQFNGDRNAMPMDWRAPDR
ncbi:MAG: hypothetical protein JW384_01404 [Nitrosomonadaceae bacterium]|nr:hypothetical protein [Nitrosomonadaceae bacterium]